jgi:hypothetical protein
MIFNNSKNLHRLINCWGPGEGPGGSLGGASSDGGMGGTGSMGGNTGGMSGGPSGGNITGITPNSPFTVATSKAISPRGMNFDLAGKLGKAGSLFGSAGALVGILTGLVVSGSQMVSENEAMGIKDTNDIVMDSNSGTYYNLGPGGNGEIRSEPMVENQGIASGFVNNYLASGSPAQTAASYEQQALDYLKESDALPKQFREGALKGLGGVYGLEGGTGSQQEMIDRALQSPLYGALMGGQKAGEESILRNASATGGLRSGNVQANMYDYNTQLANQALLQSYNEQMQGLQGLSGLSSNANAIANRTSKIGETISAGQTAARAEDEAKSQQLWDNIFGIGKLGLDLYSSGMFSDRRLKKDIKKVGELKGFNIYSWTWNQVANKIGLSGKTIGCMADEVYIKNPNAVSIKDHFMFVHYDMLGIFKAVQNG